jgi:hypothetical protein
MNNGTYIFEIILKQPELMNIFDQYISQTITNGLIEIHNIPKLVLNISRLINNYLNDKLYKLNIKCKEDDINIILEHFYIYITDKIHIEFNSDEFYSVYTSCVQLSIMKYKYSNKKALLCFRKK